MVALALLGTALIWCAPGATAWASPLAQEDVWLLGDGLDAPRRDADFVRELNETMAANPPWWGYSVFLDLDELFFGIVRDENWALWQDYQRNPGTILPAVPAMSVINMVAEGYMPKTLKVTMELEETLAGQARIKVTYLPDRPSSVGGLGLGPNPIARKSPMDPFRWVRDQFDDITTKPWSWDNFIRRILFIGGMIIMALLMVEATRFVVTLLRRMGGAN